MDLAGIVSPLDSDRLHPMLVKDLRQMFSGVAFGATLHLFLLVMWLGACLVVLTAPQEQLRQTAGRDVLWLVYHGLLMVSLVVVPVQASASLLAELSEGCREMLSLTTRVTPRGILAGKLYGAAVHVGAYYAIALPYLSCAYLLNGLPLEALLWIVLYPLLLCMVQVVWAMCLTVALPRWLGGLGLLICLSSGCVAWIVGEITLGLVMDGSLLSCLGGLLVVGIILLGLAAAESDLIVHHLSGCPPIALPFAVVEYGGFASGTAFVRRPLGPRSQGTPGESIPAAFEVAAITKSESA